MKYFLPHIATAIAISFFCGCTKSNEPTPVVNTVMLQYPDSVFYVTGQKDYKISPLTKGTGNYYSFPEGLIVDQKTGIINISESDAGLKYRVTFIPDATKDTSSAFITISGINYFDGFYNLSKGDSILRPVYNANKFVQVPGLNNGTTFDVGSNFNSQGCKVNPITAEINLAESIRKGVFGNSPSNNDRKEFEMTYRINDKSNKNDNKLRVKLYFFKSMSEVSPEAFDIIASRQGTIIGPDNITSAPLLARAAKPRPPCIFIVSH